MDKWEDEIVAEVRAVRDAYAQRFAYDVRAICRDLKRSQEAGNRKGLPGQGPVKDPDDSAFEQP
jgi:hypothetical protein